MATWFYQHLPAAEAGEPAPGESPPAARVRWACELAATERWLDATPRADHPDRAHRPRARALAGHEQALVLGDGVYFPALIGFFLALADSRPGDGMLVTINGWRYRQASGPARQSRA